MADTSAEPVKRAARNGIALGLAVGTSGLAFGAAAVASGLSVAQACVLSLIAYTGASQFALAAAVAGGGSLIAGTASAVLLGSRNGLYGLRLASLLGFRGPFRLLAALGITDELTAVALAQAAGGQPGRAAVRAGFLATFASLYLTWNAGTLAGALGAGRLGSANSFGLECGGSRGVPGAAVAPAARRPDRTGGRAGRGRYRAGRHAVLPAWAPGGAGRGGRARRRLAARRRGSGACGLAPRCRLPAPHRPRPAPHHPRPAPHRPRPGRRRAG